jgi:hypothetical protein
MSKEVPMTYNKLLSQYFSGGNKEIYEIVRIANLRAEIRTRDLPYTKQES